MIRLDAAHTSAKPPNGTVGSIGVCGGLSVLSLSVAVCDICGGLWRSVCLERGFVALTWAGQLWCSNSMNTGESKRLQGWRTGLYSVQDIVPVKN